MTARRSRMGDSAWTPKDAKTLYKRRAATAECVNAQAHKRSLQRLPVRNLQKVRCTALLYALAQNLMRTLALASQLLGLGTTSSAAGAGTVLRPKSSGEARKSDPGSFQSARRAHLSRRPRRRALRRTPPNIRSARRECFTGSETLPYAFQARLHHRSHALHGPI